jgi:transposase
MARGPKPNPLSVSRRVRRELKLLVRRQRAPFSEVQRARIVLLARAGVGTASIAGRIGCDERTVRKWKARFAEDPRVEALRDASRSGRPSVVTIATRCELVQLACERPDGITTPFREVWTYGSLSDALHARTGCRLSESEVGRILRFESLRPHRVKQWLKSRDPDFTAKAERVCDLYLNPPKGAVLLCIDEKPMQVLERRHPTHIGADGRVRYEYEYKRQGTQVLLAAFDVRTGHVTGRVFPRRTSENTVAFMDEVAKRYRGREIYVVWDNLNTHYDGPEERWTRFNERHGGRFHFVYTPMHASWLNQVEIWFSILHRRVLKYGSFDTAERQQHEIEAFIRFWNENEKRPFRWTWRTDGLQNPRCRAA